MKVTHASQSALRVVSVAMAAFALMLAFSFTGAPQAHATLAAGEPDEQLQLSVSAQATSIENAKLTLSRTWFLHDGNIHQPTVKAINGLTSLVKDTDYTVAYSWASSEIGIYKVMVTGIGNYSGYTEEIYSIKPNIATDVAISGIAGKTYNGKVQLQSAVIKDDGTTLKAGTDYTVSYKNNVNAGTATVTFTGTGNQSTTTLIRDLLPDDYHYLAGSVSKTFKIAPAPISKATLVLKYSSHAYTGKALKPALKTAKYGSVALKAGTDYTLSYKANKNVGTATVIVKGRGNFTGEKKLTFKINPPKPKVMLTASRKRLLPEYGNQKGIDIKWSLSPVPPASEVDGYKVQISTSKSFPKGAAKTSTKAIKRGSKLYKLRKIPTATGGPASKFKVRPNTTYYVRIQAYNKVGGKTYSVWSNVAKCKTVR